MRSWPPLWTPPMDKALRYLGLAARAGRVTVGTEDCAKRSRRERGGLVVTAADAGDNALRRAAAMTETGAAGHIRCGYTRLELAQALGRSGPVAMAVIWDDGLAEAFAAAAKRI